MTPTIMQHEEIILTITEEYQHMRRKLFLKKRIMKNKERINLQTSKDKLVENQIDVGEDDTLIRSCANTLETIKIVLKSKKKNSKTSSFDIEVLNNDRST